MCPPADVMQFLYIPNDLQEACFLHYGKLNNKINISLLEWTFPGRKLYKFPFNYSADVVILSNVDYKKKNTFYYYSL